MEKELRLKINKLQRIKFIQDSLNNVRRIIFFVCPQLDGFKSKITVLHPPKQFGDVSINALIYFYKIQEPIMTKQEFIESLKMFIPNENIEEENGMLNIYFKNQDLIDCASIINS